MSIQFINADEVMKFHDWILENSMGLSGLADRGRIDAMLMRVENCYYYENITDVFQLAATYFLAIARGHCFADANKRTALFTTVAFLKRNNIQLSNSMELVDITVNVAAGNYCREELANCLKKYATDI